MKIRTVAGRFGVSVQTVRDWLEFFEIEVERNAHNQRIISDDVLEKLELIKNELDFGSSRGDIYQSFFKPTNHLDSFSSIQDDSVITSNPTERNASEASFEQASEPSFSNIEPKAYAQIETQHNSNSTQLEAQFENKTATIKPQLESTPTQFEPLNNQIDTPKLQEKENFSSTKKRTNLLQAIALFSLANTKTLQILLLIALLTTAILVFKQHKENKKAQEHQTQNPMPYQNTIYVRNELM